MVAKDPVPASPQLARGGGFGVRDALGLSQGYKCTHSFIFEVAEGGGRLTIRQPASEFESSCGHSDELSDSDGGNLLKVLRGISDSSDGVPDLPKRGRISEWSAPSRRNFRKFMGGLKLGALDEAMMVSLTYPGEFPEPDSHDVYKGHLRSLKARMNRKFPISSFVWKLEFQARGAAHYHLIVFGLGAGDSALAAWKKWIDLAWYEIVGSGDERHFRAGVTSEWVRTRGGAVSYLTKYLGKDDQTRPGDFTGRYWGCFNKDALPLAPVRREEKTDREAVLIRRVIRKLTASQVNARRKQRLVKKLGFWSKVGASVMDMEAWHANPGCPRFLPSVSPQWTGPSRLTLPNPEGSENMWAPPLPFRMPPKYRVRNNLTATLFCDASAVAAQLEKWVSTATVGTSSERIRSRLRDRPGFPAPL